MSLLGRFARFNSCASGRSAPFSLRPVPGPGCPFESAFFRPGRVYPPDPCAVAPVPAAVRRSLPRVARVARAGAERRVRQSPEPLSRPCTTQWCDKLSLPAPENLRQEPAQIPLPPLLRTWTRLAFGRYFDALRRSITQIGVDYARRDVLTCFFKFEQRGGAWFRGGKVSEFQGFKVSKSPTC